MAETPAANCEGTTPATPAVVPTPAVAPTTQPTQVDPNAPEQWKNRRLMAYLALFSMLAVMIAMFSPTVSVERINAMENITEWFFITMGSIVAAYTGFATYSAVKLSQTTTK